MTIPRADRACSPGPRDDVGADLRWQRRHLAISLMPSFAEGLPWLRSNLGGLKPTAAGAVQ
ncbi:MAG: hypothetical protein RIS76_2566 [Verrucomicrobiota bacterium]